MQINVRNLIEALKRAAADNGMTQSELGQSLGFSADKTKNVFSGRSSLNGDDVLRILSDPRYPLPRLKKYLPYWELRRELVDVKEDSITRESINESATMFSQRIQCSPLPTNDHKPLTELARDIMNDKKWWALRTGWICSAKVNDTAITFTPIAPNFTTATISMKKMGWIKREGNNAHAFWGKINGGKTGEEAATYCEETLRDYILDHHDEFNLDESFMQIIRNDSVRVIEIDRMAELQKRMAEIDDMVEHWTRYELSDQADEYGLSPKALFQDKFDYLENNVLTMLSIHADLIESNISIDPSLERQYQHILSADGHLYKGAVLIDPILAVNDRRDRLATPTSDDWKRYNNLKGDR